MIFWKSPRSTAADHLELKTKGSLEHDVVILTQLYADFFVLPSSTRLKVPEKEDLPHRPTQTSLSKPCNQS